MIIFWFGRNKENRMPRPAKIYGHAARRVIADKVSMLMAPQLTNCLPRRFDISTSLIPRWPIELWFAQSGPIVPKILTQTSTGSIYFELYYGLMFRDRLDFLTTEIYDCKALEYISLERRPEAIAEAAIQGFRNIDLAEFVARGTPDGVLKSRPLRDFALICLQLAECALYAGRDDEAARLLHDTIHYAAKDSLNRYADLAAEAQSYLSRLDSDAAAIRKELALKVDYSWSHFSIATS
jgi:hypothetical protein